MRYVLENELLKVEIDSLGAEVKSIINKSNGHEYLWHGAPGCWGGTSPILFPFVGRLKNDSFLHGGVTYSMPQHGFAKDIEHNLISKTDDSIMFKLVTNDDTLKCFPFSFSLHIGYELKGNELNVSWEVRNNSREKHMHFAIGGHPAFNCTYNGETSKAGYQLYFEGADEIHYHGITRDTGLSIKEDIVLPLTNNRVTLTSDFFERGTYIVEGNQTKAVGLEDPNGNRIVTVLFDMPLFGIWSQEQLDAPFVCIEPWCGRCDSEDFEGTLKAREFDNVLEAGEKFNTSYIIRFGG